MSVMISHRRKVRRSDVAHAAIIVAPRRRCKGDLHSAA